MQPWHVFGGSINAVWQRRIGGQKPREKGARGLRCAPGDGSYEGRMTESRRGCIGCSVRSSRSPRQFMTIGIAAVTRSRDAARLQEGSATRHLIKLVQLAASARKNLCFIKRHSVATLFSLRIIDIIFNISAKKWNA